MSWSPPERPKAVRAILDGEVALLAEEAALPLTRDALVAEAAAQAGLGVRSAAEIDRALGHPEFEAAFALENLGAFLDSLNREAELNTVGRILTRRFLLRLLSVRIEILRYIREDPSTLDEEIRAPLFVAGAPRTGTTILHTLLAADPEHRVPEAWELLFPVPPPAPNSIRGDAHTRQDPFADDPRIDLANRELIRPQSLVSGLLSIHEYGGRKPKECLSAMSFAFESEEFTARYHVPSFAARLAQSEMHAAYKMHRLVLQIRQRAQANTAWVLKSPVHLHVLPTVLNFYPDARLAVTHRDPVTLLASLTNLIANLRFAHSDHVDPGRIAEAHLDRYATTFDRLVDWTEAGALPEEQIHHSRFADFQTEPIETTERLYAKFGKSLGTRARAAMQSALDANPADRHGAHRYARASQDEAGQALRTRFARYQAAFSVPSDDGEE
ncbi:MAG: sulfotransferase [Myxococcota bacterium]